MNLLQKLNDFLFQLKYSDVPANFTSARSLFELKFEPNWIYSKKGNSFYTFHNEKDDLKGGLQFSLQWKINSPPELTEKEALINLIYGLEGEEVGIQERNISKYKALYYLLNNDESNMDHHNWVIYRNKVLVTITFLIFEEEPAEIKEKWLNKVMKILNSLVLHDQNFLATRMR